MDLKFLFKMLTVFCLLLIVSVVYSVGVWNVGTVVHEGVHVVDGSADYSCVAFTDRGREQIGCVVYSGVVGVV